MTIQIVYTTTSVAPFSTFYLRNIFYKKRRLSSLSIIPYSYNSISFYGMPYLNFCETRNLSRIWDIFAFTCFSIKFPTMERTLPSFFRKTTKCLPIMFTAFTDPTGRSCDKITSYQPFG